MSHLVLAIDTATTRTSVALLDGSRTLIELSRDGATEHGEALPELVTAALKGFSPTQLHGIAVGIGPGPYTGLRVGIAFARSMAWALGIGVVGVCTLDALAHDYSMQGRVSGDFAVATDARRKEVYWAVYDGDGNRRDEPIAVRSSDIPPHLLALPTLGSGAALYPQEFVAHLEPLYPTATSIGQLGLGMLARSHLQSTEPMYLRRPDVAPPPSAMLK